MGHDVFISHSAKDKVSADAVCATLEANGIRCWIAPRDIIPGESWASSILKGIASCRVMVLVFSAHANSSAQIRREVERAVHRGIAIAPVRISDVMPEGDMEYFLSSQHWMDALTPPFDKHLRTMAAKVRRLLEMEGAQIAAPPDLATASASSVASRGALHGKHRAWPAIIAASALLVAVAAGWVWRDNLRERLAGTRTPTPAAQFEASGTPSNLGDVWTNTLGMKFAYIPAGEFVMGSPAGEDGRYDNETQHRVKITKPFVLGIHHVTRGLFATFVKEAAYQTEAEKEGFGYATNGTTFHKVNGASWKAPGFDQTDDHPVVNVTYNDAQAFRAWISKKEGKTYRLPTEAEWEYACRAGTNTASFWGDNPDGGQGFANCADLTAKEKFPNWPTFNWRDGFIYTSPVGSFKPNPWGLYDMIGNAFEWCDDYYGPYPDRAAVDPTGPVQGDNRSSRVLRGGSWTNDLRGCRAAYRYWDSPGRRLDSIGFRLALDVP